MDEQAPGGSSPSADAAPPADAPPPAPAPPAPAVIADASPPAGPAAAYGGAYDAPPGYGYGAPPGYGYPGSEGAAIHAPGYAAPPPQRSGAASAIGILGIVFGVLIALGGGLQIGCRALLQNLQAPAARTAELMRLLQLEMGIWGVMTLMSIALIVIGVGVWRHRETARKAMLVWSALALAVIAGRMAVQAFVMQPRAAKYQQEMLEQQGQKPGPETEQILRMGRAWAVFGDLVLWAPYPVVALLLLTRRSVRDRCS
jgi:hypothetical protein